jgi:DNA (cytosine-5)-methyltransferase 1
MRFLELFAGAGGMSLGLERAGMACVGHAEIEPHARAVLRHTWPDVPLYGDVTTLNGATLMATHPFDLVSFGAPCQDLSVAGKRAGLDGARSSLFFDGVRIWNESGATYALYENVYGALSSNNGADFARVLSALVGAAVPVPRDGWRRGGVASGPAAVAAWRVLDLQHVPGDDWPAPPQRRVRVFVLAARAGGVDPAEVLALGEGVCGHPAPREQAREGIARGAGAGVAGGGVVPIGEVTARQGTETHGSSAMIGEAGDPMFTLTSKQHGVLAWDNELNAADELHGPLMARGKSGGDRNGVLAFAVRGRDGGAQAEVSDVSPALRTPGGGSSHPHVLAFAENQRGEVLLGDVTRQITTGGGKPGQGYPAVITYDARGNGDGATVNTLAGDHQNRVTDYTALCITGPVTHSLTHEGADASEDGTGRGTPIVVPTLSMGAHTAAPGSNGQDALEYAAITTGLFGRPRRLTPLECERLMAWPDAHTARGVDEKGREYALSDTARYRLCGNGIGSTQAEWIGRNLMALEAATAAGVAA